MKQETEHILQKVPSKGNIKEREMRAGSFSIEPLDENGHLHFLGTVPAPVKLDFKRGIASILRKQRAVDTEYLNCSIPSDHGKLGPEIWKSEDFGAFPDVMVAFGPDALCDGAFYRRAVKSGAFASPLADGYSRFITDADQQDALFQVFAVSPYVMLIDKRKLGSSPCPHHWGELLSSEYRGKIILEGARGMVSSIILYQYFRQYGEDGVAGLAENTVAVWPAAKMIAKAGKSGCSTGAVYITPWFFAKCCPDEENFMVIWPEDGALFYPLFLLARKGLPQPVKELVNYITGPRFGACCAHGFCPSLHSQADNHLPKNAAFAQPVFRAVRKYDLEELKGRLRQIFFMHYGDDTIV